MLDQQMDALLKLPERVSSLEAQFLQFRDETRREFADVRSVMRQQFDLLGGEMRAGDEETRRHARVLHEEVIGRIALLDERWSGHSDERNRASPKTPSGRDRKR